MAFHPFTKLTTALASLGFVALFCIVGMTLWLSNVSQKDFERTLKSRDLRSAAAELRNGLQAAESSQRGFLVTGNEIYLAPLGAAKTLANKNYKHLAQLLADDDKHTKALRRLGDIVTAKIDEIDRTIAFKRSGDENAVAAIVASNAGKRLMDEANVFITAIIQRVDSELLVGVGNQRSHISSLRLVSIFGAFVIIAVVMAVWRIVTNYTDDLMEVRDEVLTLNEGLEERVRQRTDRLAQANNEIQRFAYVVTHDLRAPLVNIMGFTSELERAVQSLRAPDAATGDMVSARDQDLRLAQDEDIREAIGFIRSSTKKMDGLINSILQLARAGQRSMRLETVNVAELLETVRRTLQHQILAASGEIKFDLEVPAIVSDRTSLEQVFANMLENAIKYRAEGRLLRITVRNTKLETNAILFEIADNGRGIAAHDIERIFEMFRRSGSQDETGDGIGLAHVRTILRKLDGEIQVDSELGGGTTFRIILPELHKSDGNAPI